MYELFRTELETSKLLKKGSLVADLEIRRFACTFFMPYHKRVVASISRTIKDDAKDRDDLVICLPRTAKLSELVESFTHPQIERDLINSDFNYLLRTYATDLSKLKFVKMEKGSREGLPGMTMSWLTFTFENSNADEITIRLERIDEINRCNSDSEDQIDIGLPRSTSFAELYEAIRHPEFIREIKRSFFKNLLKKN